MTKEKGHTMIQKHYTKS